MTRKLRYILSAAFMLLLMSVAACGEKAEDVPTAPGGEMPPPFEQQSRLLETALAGDPENVTILIQLGNLYYDWGEQEVRSKGNAANPVPKWTSAIGYYSRALEKDEANVNVRTDMANLLRYVGKTDEAIEHFRIGKKADPKHPQTRINLLLTLAGDKKDYAAAIKEYEDLIKAIPEQAQNMPLQQEVDSYRAILKEAGK